MHIIINSSAEKKNIHEFSVFYLRSSNFQGSFATHFSILVTLLTTTYYYCPTTTCTCHFILGGFLLFTTTRRLEVQRLPTYLCCFFSSSYSTRHIFYGLSLLLML